MTAKMVNYMYILHYKESDWGDDIVCFNVPNTLTPYDIMTTLEIYKSAVDIENYETAQDFAQEVCTKTALELGGTWDYVCQYGTLDIESC